MEYRYFRALMFFLVLMVVTLLLIAPTIPAQPRDINGTVVTPAGRPIMDAHAYIDPGTYGSSYEIIIDVSDAQSFLKIP